MSYDPDAREKEALAEIEATRIPRPVAAALLAGFLLLIACGPVAELVAALAARETVWSEPLGWSEFEGGLLARLRAAIAEIDRRADERTALVRRTRPTVQALLSRFLRFGNERAIVGADGWLFFRDDVEHLVSRRPGADASGDPCAEILAFRDELARRGIALLVVPIPVKPTVHPERLARSAAPPLRRRGESELFARLAGRGVELLDLADRFARDSRLAPLYLSTDTHWRPEALEIAAREIALRLREIAELPAGSEAAFAEERRTIAGRGDTAILLGLGEDSGLFAPESVETRVVTPPAPAGTGAAVLLLGDSFSAVYGAPDLGWGRGAGLAERLAWQLGLPVDRIVRNAGGASATREALARELAADPGRLVGVRAVVWQFAARELSQGAWRPTPLRAPQGSD